MKKKMITLVFLAVLLSSGLCTKVNAQNMFGHGTRRSYTVYAPDSSFDNYYDHDYYNWRYHPRKYFKHKYWAERRYHDYYYNEKYRRYNRYRDRWDDDKYYYRGGGY